LLRSDLIVFEIAHEVRNTATKRYQAVKDLSARCRWCLTGTPIQNTLDDLAALVGFLRVPILDDKQTFRKFITPKNGMGSRYENLRILLGTICLRRTRQLLGLPDPVPETREVALSEKERQQYLNIIERSKESVDMAVSKRGRRTLNAAVLESLLRLRLFCNNGSVSTSYTDTEGLPTDLDEALTYLQQRGDAQCVYCFKDIYILSRKTKTNTEGGIIIPKCNHLVCHMCRSQFNEQHQKCPSPECSKSKELKSRDKLAEARSALSANSREHHNLNEDQTALTSIPHSVDTPSKLLVFINDLELELSRFHKPKWYDFI
jgi:SWI/SNF-related matrix-associated actin-dependent regulator of chromatin subfamily A3